MSVPSRRSIVVVAVLLVLALLASAAIDRTEAARLAARERIASALVELGISASLRDESGRATLRPLPVAANLEGGPMWLHAELQAAIEADEALELADSPNLVRVEVVGSEYALGLATSLYRQGWNLRLPHPTRIRIAPWVATITAVLGVMVACAWRRAGWGLAVAGVAAQLVASWLPWEVPLQPSSWAAAVREGPIGSTFVAWAQALPDASLSIGAGVIVLCTILVVLDNRRSPARGGLVLVSGMAGVAGLLLWVEAAARCGLLGWARTGAGALALVILVAAWVLSVAAPRALGARPRLRRGA
jgi:hypothetical protein